MAQIVGMYAKHTMDMGWPSTQQNDSLKIEKRFGVAQSF